MRFLVNDPDYAPFDAAWLRGVTPLRLAALLVICMTSALSVVLDWFVVHNDYGLEAREWVSHTIVRFACALPMFILIIKTEIRTARSRPAVRIAALVGAVVVGAVLYAALRSGVRYLGPRAYQLAWVNTAAQISGALFKGGLLTAILYYASRDRAVARSLHDTQLAEIGVEKQVAEARLKLLRAQIEPHFLFNSLASVKRLYEREPGKARALLGNLKDYLRAATRGARQREASLGDEIALARSFLGIFQVRMGDRLRVHVDVPAGIETAQIPPFMLGTLVENAIKHGIGPRASGGTLGLAARRDGEVLEVNVGDDGLGFRDRSGHGIGLANTRARLETLFGSAATLDLAANPGGGITATIRLPFRLAAEGPRS